MNNKPTEEQQKALDDLRAIFPEGCAVTTLIRHASRSGARWSISVLVGRDLIEGVSDVSWLVARAGFGRFDQKNGGVIRNGGGMDMGFDLVYSLSRALYGDGYALRHNRI